MLREFILHHLSTMKSHYIDAFVLVIKKNQTDAYKKMAEDGCRMWMKHGALSYRECIGDDIDSNMSDSPMLGFRALTHLQDDETVWFSYIEYESKAHRDEVNKKVMEEWGEKMTANPELATTMAEMMDMNKFSVGGFEIMVSN